MLEVLILLVMKFSILIKVLKKNKNCGKKKINGKIVQIIIKAILIICNMDLTHPRLKVCKWLNITHINSYVILEFVKLTPLTFEFLLVLKQNLDVKGKSDKSHNFLFTCAEYINCM